MKGKTQEHPENHVMIFHIWCLSNSLMDDSIILRLIQRNLTGMEMKWYIDPPRDYFQTFKVGAMDFLNHF